MRFRRCLVVLVLVALAPEKDGKAEREAAVDVGCFDEENVCLFVVKAEKPEPDAEEAFESLEARLFAELPESRGVEEEGSMSRSSNTGTTFRVRRPYVFTYPI